MDQSSEMAKVVFRTYTAEVFIGESVKIFEGSTFPKRSQVGEPGSYTIDSDLALRRNGEIIGAITAFIRLTAFGENIISECIKDGGSYRVRMTSLIVERNKDPKKNVKPWWVILDGRRLRFSRWLRALEREDCTKEVYLMVKKSTNSDELNDLPRLSDPSLQSEENSFMELAEASLKKDFDIVREYNHPFTEDKGSQVNLGSVPTFQINSLDVINCSIIENNISLYNIDKEHTNLTSMKMNSEEDIEKMGLLSETGLSLEAEQKEIPKQMTESEIFEQGICFGAANKCTSHKHENQEYSTKVEDIFKKVENNTPLEDHILQNVEWNDVNKITNYGIVKSDDIFHFERSISDYMEEATFAKEYTSNVISSNSEEKCTMSEVVTKKTSTVTDKSFLAESIVIEIISLLIEGIFEIEYNSSLHEKEKPETPSGVKAENVRDVGFVDIESTIVLSTAGIAEATACIQLSTVSDLVSPTGEGVPELAGLGRLNEAEGNAMSLERNNITETSDCILDIQSRGIDSYMQKVQSE